MADRATTRARTSSLGHRAARGAFVTFGGQGIRIVVQMASVVVLARLLDPGDYGLIAMVTAVVGVADIFRDFGLSSAAVQAKELTAPQRDNLHWINTGIGLLLCGLVFAAAPVVARFYGRDELVDITRALAVVFALNGFATQYRAGLNRAMRFSSLALADVLGAAGSLVVALVVALRGGGYWALVAQQLSQASIMLGAVAVQARWWPGRPRRGVPMAALLRFGWNYVGSQLVGYAGNNFDSVLIGARFGAAPLGLYNRGFQLLMKPLGQLRAPSTTVALPVLSRLHGQDQRYAEFVARGQVALGYSLVLAMGLVVGAAAPLTALLLGPGWSAVVPILRLLAVAGAFQTLAFVGLWVYLSRGLTKELRTYTFISTGIRIVCIAAGSTWGVVGVAAGFAVAPAIAWPISFWWLSRHTAIPVRELITGGVRIVLLAGATAAAAYVGSVVCAGQAPIVAVSCAAGAAVLTVSLLALLLPVLRRDLLIVLDVGRRALAR